MVKIQNNFTNSQTDPVDKVVTQGRIQDFPWRRRAWTHFGGRGPLTRLFFGKNVCENERIGSRGGGELAPKNFVCRPNVTLSPCEIFLPLSYRLK